MAVVYICIMKLKQFIMKISKAYQLKKYQKQCKESYDKHMEESYKKYQAWLESTKKTCHFISK